MAVIPKKMPGKWRVIVDLSHPGDRSVNHLIWREATHVAYSFTGDAAHLMHFLGRNALMAKLDIKEEIQDRSYSSRRLQVCWSLLARPSFRGLSTAIRPGLSPCYLSRR